MRAVPHATGPLLLGLSSGSYGGVVSPITFFGFIALGVKHGFDDAIVPVVVHGITLCWLAGRIWCVAVLFTFWSNTRSL